MESDRPAIEAVGYNAPGYPLAGSVPIIDADGVDARDRPPSAHYGHVQEARGRSGRSHREASAGQDLARRKASLYAWAAWSRHDLHGRHHARRPCPR